MKKIGLLILFIALNLNIFSQNMYNREAILTELKNYLEYPDQYARKKEIDDQELIRLAKKVDDQAKQIKVMKDKKAENTGEMSVPQATITPPKEVETVYIEVPAKNDAPINTTPARTEEAPPARNNDAPMPVEYRIQLGVQNNPLPGFDASKPMRGEFINGKFVYNIGGFASPQDAFGLSTKMRTLDLKGAFVVKYVNGVRDYNYRFDPNDFSGGSSSSDYPTNSQNSNSKPKGKPIYYDPDDVPNAMKVNMPESNRPAKKSEVGFE
jgi:hypothetical protein